jgi:hypothetical protein
MRKSSILRGATLAILLATPAAAQTPLAIPESRDGSGTSWLPDAAEHTHWMRDAGAWSVMLHGHAFAFADAQGGPRGANRLGVIDWAMVEAARGAGGGRLTLRAMFSTEPWTVGARGYPLLLQSGESYQGAPLHDRQHPHDLFVELAARYQHAVTKDFAFDLYVAPVGEPAVGPVAYPHRPSAAADPFAPLAHHWQDATHIAFGVITAGVFTQTLKLEASAFNGREPDENRTNFDYRGRRLDSFGARVTVNPVARWSVAAWYAYLKSPEALTPAEAIHRFGASALVASGNWSGALIYGANARRGGPVDGSVTVEGARTVGATTLFGRAEWVRKHATDLSVPAAPPEQRYGVAAFSFGALRDLQPEKSVSVGLGARGSVNLVPPALSTVYGGRAPLGAALYLRFAPGHGGMADMPGMMH